MGFRKCQTIFVNVVTVCALDFCNRVATAGNQSNHVDPEYILHATSRYGAAVFFGKGEMCIRDSPYNVRNYILPHAVHRFAQVVSIFFGCLYRKKKRQGRNLPFQNYFIVSL